MPVQFYIITGVCIAVMAYSAFYIGDEDKRSRALARAGLVVGASVLFVSSMFYFSILIAVLIVVLPVALIVMFFQGFFS